MRLGAAKLKELGALMYQSHASYSKCGLGADATDRIVELVKEAGPRAHLYGAKITGGGCGGTVCILGRDSPRAQRSLERIIIRYAHEAQRFGVPSGQVPLIFSGSSMGAANFGALRVSFEDDVERGAATRLQARLRGNSARKLTGGKSTKRKGCLLYTSPSPRD